MLYWRRDHPVFLSVCSDVGRRKRRNGEALKAVSSQTSKIESNFFILVEFTRRNTVINDEYYFVSFDTWVKQLIWMVLQRQYASVKNLLCWQADMEPSGRSSGRSEVLLRGCLANPSVTARASMDRGAWWSHSPGVHVKFGRARRLVTHAPTEVIVTLRFCMICVWPTT